MSEPEFFDFENSEDPELTPREDLALWVGEFMAQAVDAENIYRGHFCNILADRIYQEFGYEGFCEMMMTMDRKAGWISDIIIENSDIDDILFKKYGLYDPHAIAKARASRAMEEMNGKIWRLRKKLARQVAEELVASGKEEAIDPGLIIDEEE
jgi:hypothetical protein